MNYYDNYNEFMNTVGKAAKRNLNEAKPVKLTVKDIEAELTTTVANMPEHSEWLAELEAAIKRANTRVEVVHDEEAYKRACKQNLQSGVYTIPDKSQFTKRVEVIDKTPAQIKKEADKGWYDLLDFFNSNKTVTYELNASIYFDKWIEENQELINFGCAFDTMGFNKTGDRKRWNIPCTNEFNPGFNNFNLWDYFNGGKFDAERAKRSFVSYCVMTRNESRQLPELDKKLMDFWGIVKSAYSYYTDRKKRADEERAKIERAKAEQKRLAEAKKALEAEVNK